MESIDTLIDNGIYDLFIEYTKVCYHIQDYLRKGLTIYKDDWTFIDDFDFLVKRKQLLYWKLGNDTIDVCERFRKSLSAKKRRLRQRISGILENADIIYKYFITINFNDYALKLNAETRKTYVRRYLKENFIEYVANIDFGSDKEYIDRNGNERKATKREHYHAVVGFNGKIDFNNFTLGGIDFERIRLNVASVGKLGSYINKITSHAYKRSTGFNGCIYSRNAKKDIKIF